MPFLDDNLLDLPVEQETGFLTLRLRSAAYKSEVVLKVKPSATCDKVVAAYLSKIPAGTTLTPAKRKAVHITLEGEKQDFQTTMADLDVEDGDCLDIGGL